MADIKWIKIVTDIFDDEKILLIEGMPESDSLVVIWFKLLCLAGKNNNSGVFTLSDKIPYTEEMLSTIFRRDVELVKLAIKTFERFGMIEIVEGVITIPNWGKHQSFDKIETKNSYMRGYMREYRQKQKALISGEVDAETNKKVNSKINGKSNSKANVSEADKNKNNKKHIGDSAEPPAHDYDVLFERLWALYPPGKKKGKASVKATRRKVILKIGYDEMSRALDRFTADMRAEGRGIKYWMQGSTFFNGGYMDYLDANYEIPLDDDEEMEVTYE